MSEIEFLPRPLRKRAPGADFVQPGLQAYRDDFGEVRGYKATLPSQSLGSNTGLDRELPQMRPVTTQPGSGGAGGGSDGGGRYTLDTVLE